MSGTVFITGANAGVGIATTTIFLSKGWNVAATARNPNSAADLKELQKKFPNQLLIQELDLDQHESIPLAIKGAISKFGRVDVLVNNAGFGLFVPLELLDMNTVQKQFEANVFGPMRLTKAILPHFHTAPRSRLPRIINISSGAGWIGFPLASAYTASKGALELLSESLRFELAAFDPPVLVKVVVPDGGISNTNFMTASGSMLPDVDRAMDMTDKVKNTYKAYMATVFESFTTMSANNMEAIEVANRIVEAATDDKPDRLRYFIGPGQKPSILLTKRLAGPEKEGDTPDDIDDSFIRLSSQILSGGTLH
ncbi:short-chain alcohol dehydrogenase [Fusarium austroafricanum]|uniref:Short-chain alcohol dehydrogenase n=1 Tax=Fusarium austroafricanum TaxID=2364996 RepID=A0A8H4K6M2_9HYPO|nr:short-chain alcohol dehydrogenase [Fusarium austroafricanum]